MNSFAWSSFEVCLFRRLAYIHAILLGDVFGREGGTGGAGGILLRSGEPVRVPVVRAGEPDLRGAWSGAGVATDAARGGTQGGRAAGPDIRKEQGELPAPGHPPLRRALRASDGVPRPFPLPHLEDDAGSGSAGGR